jgi:hypothetical protein
MQMKRFKVVGLCLAAVFALCAVLAAGAQAATPPEYKVCIKASPKNTGNYSGKECADAQKVAGTGKYERAEFNKGKKVTFKGKNSGTPKNIIVNPAVGLEACIIEGVTPVGGGGDEESQAAAEKTCIGEIAKEPGKTEGTTECTKEKPEGSVTGPKTTTWKTVYKKCKGNGVPCNTKGKGKEEIVTDPLEATLVNLDKGPGHKRVGIRVKGLGPGGRLAEYECPAQKVNIEVFGEVLAEQKGNLNSAAKTTEDVVKAGPLNLQSDLYEAEAFSEEGGKGTIVWSILFGNCVKEGVEPISKGGDEESKAAAEGTCFGEIGGPPASAPTTLISVVTGAIEAKAPAVQNGVTINKGEAMLIEDN